MLLMLDGHQPKAQLLGRMEGYEPEHVDAAVEAEDQSKEEHDARRHHHHHRLLLGPLWPVCMRISISISISTIGLFWAQSMLKLHK